MTRRVKTPTVIQMEASECGAAALAIVLGYYGVHVPLEVLREDCGIGRDGSKAVNVLKAARKYGMVAKGYRKETDRLSDLTFPTVLFWNFNHFLVLEGMKGDRVYLNDPASGPRTVDRETLDRCFTGVALSITPGPDFRPEGKPRSTWASLRKRLYGARWAVTFAVLAGLALVVPGILNSSFQQIFVDRLLVEGRMEWFRPLLSLMAAMALVKAVLTWLQSSSLLRQETSMALRDSAGFMVHLFRLPYVFFLQRYAGEIGNRVQLNDQVAQLISRDLASTVLQCLMVGFYGVVIVLYDPPLALVAVGACVAALIMLAAMNRRRSDLNERLTNEIGRFAGTAMGGLNVIETVKSFGGEDDQFARLAGHMAKVLEARTSLGLFSARVEPVMPMLSSLSAAAILCFGGLRAMDGVLTMGMLLAIQVLMQQTLSPMSDLVGLWSSFESARGNVNRLDDVLRYPPSRPRPAMEEGGMVGLSQVRLSGRLELRNVSFGYSPLNPPLLEEFSLNLVPGSRVALVGGSGSGKSTVARIICGLFSPWSGEVLLDGRPLAEIPREQLIMSFSFVDQEISLYEGTVRENLTLWDDTIPMELLVEACKDAEIHGDIVERSGGYDAMVEENGRNFSGGQRQRLEIARALVRRPSLIVLDEATSALDSPTEEAIDRALRRRGCTCLIVAHRLSTIRDCDEIVVMKSGKVEERGTHEELIALGGRYADLIEN
ncbi:NHLP family bacteriocin export ABC transporter peptidase/permease/ATPase subunit [Dethiosulfovibrio sp. F2B]|uniref:NHLP family bacteriocin export ABC transporter peptidase/permease/ATPase subunit n=1 Tax=Dethiosulfovibrio faecalis TaxID=2720018 RepID=UPI001F3B6164|nr:NHLP family bacteriocin export ABC transporter peptidase/permease/ATPase subunit [Dethiosulfovibrio faecalis]MCF4151071.1 NHLP family bacteriocin export ABC transporter peptidase/permease/ATPase subunit [Dethiosulfovibrio faecalis]